MKFAHLYSLKKSAELNYNLFKIYINGRLLFK